MCFVKQVRFYPDIASQNIPDVTADCSFNNSFTYSFVLYKNTISFFMSFSLRTWPLPTTCHGWLAVCFLETALSVWPRELLSSILICDNCPFSWHILVVCSVNCRTVPDAPHPDVFFPRRRTTSSTHISRWHVSFCAVWCLIACFATNL